MTSSATDLSLSSQSEQEAEEPSFSQINYHDNLGYMITQVYRPFIEEHVVLTQLVPQMEFMREIFPDVMGRDTGKTKKEKDDIIMDFLRTSDERGKYRTFVDALRTMEYDFVADVLEDNREHKDHEHFKRLIELFHLRIADTIEPSSVSQKLQAKEVISRNDAEKIRNLERQESAGYAAFYLLDCIPRKKENWYNVFLSILIEEGHIELVREIDDKFLKNESEKDPTLELDSFSHTETQQIEANNLPDTSQGAENISPHESERVTDEGTNGRLALASSDGLLAPVLKELDDLKSLMLSKLHDLNKKMYDMNVKVCDLDKKLDKVLEKTDIDG